MKNTNKFGGGLGNMLLVLLSTFFTLLFIFLVGEVYLRLFPTKRMSATPKSLVGMWIPDKDIGFVNKPNFRFDPKYWWRCEETLSPKGTRGQDFKAEKPEGVYRILGLGDSVSFGVVVCNEDTFLAKLGRKLNAGKVERKYEVINASAIGYSTFQEYLYLLKYGQHWNPDMVVLTMCPNDRLCSVSPFNTSKIVPTYHTPEKPSEVKQDSGKKRKIGTGQKGWKFSIPNSRFYDFIVETIKQRVRRFGWVRMSSKYISSANGNDTRPYKRFDLAAYSESVFNTIKKISALCKKRNIKLVVLNIPYITHLNKTLANDKNRVTTFFDNNGISYLDYYDVFRKSIYKEKLVVFYRPELYLHDDHVHINKTGHNMVADKLYDIVKSSIGGD